MSDDRSSAGSWKAALRQAVKHRLVAPARYAQDRVLVRARSSDGKRRAVRRIALVSDGAAYCSEQQFHPFMAYRNELREAGTIVRSFRLDDVLASPGSLRGFDFVGLKLGYRTARCDAVELTRRMKAGMPDNARLIYFDGDDDICVQWPEVLALSDLYVKKHAFADRSQYLKKYAGKSNLHDYVHRNFGYAFKASDYGTPEQEPLIISESGPVSKEGIGKIVVGWNIGLDRPILDLHARVRGAPIDHERPVDICFRGSVKRETFTYYLRGAVGELVEGYKGRFSLSGGSHRVSQEEYYRELRESRICISPFGFGEICWRDFESVLCGALLVKPDMSHVETYPDIFIPNETYVPVKWDYSDLEEKLIHYLKNEAERRRIVERAYGAFTECLEGRRFVERVSGFLDSVERAQERETGSPRSLVA